MCGMVNFFIHRTALIDISIKHRHESLWLTNCQIICPGYTVVHTQQPYLVSTLFCLFKPGFQRSSPFVFFSPPIRSHSPSHSRSHSRRQSKPSTLLSSSLQSTNVLLFPNDSRRTDPCVQVHQLQVQGLQVLTTKLQWNSDTHVTAFALPTAYEQLTRDLTTPFSRTPYFHWTPMNIILRT